MNTNKEVFQICVDDDNPELSLTAKRGYSGIAMIWDKNIDDKITRLPERNNRFQGIQINTTEHPLCLINVYMPSDNKQKDLEYKDMLVQIEEVIQKYKTSHSIILCGDWNGSLIRNKTDHDPLLQDFVKTTELKTITNSRKETFYHHNGKSKGQIDYIFTTGINIEACKTQIMDMTATNTSDHVPVTATFNCEIGRTNTEIKHSTYSKIKWEDCNLSIYRQVVLEKATEIMEDENNTTESNIKQLENVLHKAGKMSIPNYRRINKKKTKGKSIWNVEIANASNNSKQKHRIWKQAGAPSSNNNPLKSQLIMAKKILRQAQRRAYASQREKLANKIMEASTADSGLFHTLVHRQRSTAKQCVSTLKLGDKVAETDNDILDLWKEHFEHLATPDESQPFDYEKYQLAKIQNEILEQTERGNENIAEIQKEEIEMAIRKLKSGKTADVDGIAAEHYKLAVEELTPILHYILNTVIKDLDVPSFLKTGILTPVLKKNKDKSIPANYRGITVTKTLTKILQIILKARIDKTLEIIQNRLQRGFTEQTPALFAAFLASEIIQESYENKSELLLLTLDAEKAFDKVNHEIMFNKMFHYGITGDMWILLRNMYKDMTIKVKWEGMMTSDIEVKQGIQQGANLSTSLYKCYNNSILDSVEKSGLGKYIGDICIATPTCADDILVLANSEHDLQGLMDIVHHHTQRDLVKINPTKSDLICYNTKEERKVTIGADVIRNKENATHLGLNRNPKNSVDIDSRLKTGRSTIYSLLGAGLHVRKGFSPIVSHNLWRSYALPKITYGLEIMRLKTSDLEQLETAQRKILRQLQGLPPQTSNIAVYLLLGALPIELVIDRNILSLLRSIFRDKGSIEYRLMKRQQAMKNPNGDAFVNRVDKILDKYDMPSYEDLEKLCENLTKEGWKNLVKRKQNDYWYNTCKEEQKTKSSLQYINIQEKPLYGPHNIWLSVGNDSYNVRAGETKARLATQTYLLQERRHKFNKRISPTCQLCKKQAEDIEHFILSCEKLETVRIKHLERIQSYMDIKENGVYRKIVDEGRLLHLILDCTGILKEYRLRKTSAIYIESRSQKMCYDLHLARTRLMSESL